MDFACPLYRLLAILLPKLPSSSNIAFNVTKDDTETSSQKVKSRVMLPFALQYADTTSFKKETQPTKFVLKHIRLGTISVFEEGLFFPRFIRNWITFEA